MASRSSLSYFALAVEEPDVEAGRLFAAGKGPAPNPLMYYWACEGEEDVEVPAGKMPAVFRFAYRTLGGPVNVWFAPGIGVVKETIGHSGTYIEMTSMLVRFRPTQDTSELKPPSRGPGV